VFLAVNFRKFLKNRNVKPPGTVSNLFCYSDAKKVWMVKDLIHYNLFGTPAYLRRVAALKENEEARQLIVDEKKVGADYRRPSLTAAMQHGGVRSVTSIWKLAAENAYDNDKDTVGSDYRRPSISACNMAVRDLASSWQANVHKHFRPDIFCAPKIFI